MQRTIESAITAERTPEGAGATVRRAFPNRHLRTVDPFVLLDEFFLQPPASFPPHPHGGFEIVTYIMDGGFRHSDNLGNDRSVTASGLQRITAGRGIVHAEMPIGEGLTHGLQLWINLPQRLKGIAPDYQEVPAGQLPEKVQNGARVRTIVGEGSPVRLQTDVLCLDVTLDPGARWSTTVAPDFAGVVYVVSGRGSVGADGSDAEPGRVLVLGRGDVVAVQAANEEGVRFALITGRPHGEPVRLRGSFVD